MIEDDAKRGSFPRILGLVTARGGSRGIPRKNIQLLNGKPLLAYTAEAALKAKYLSRLVLSTDDEQIACIGREYGLEVPFMRPPELALDETPTLPVVQHAIRFLEQQGDRFYGVCTLQPTNPFRTAGEIDACIDVFVQQRVDCVMTVLPVPHDCNPHWTWVKDGNGFLRLFTGEKEPVPQRQQLPEVYYRDGSTYVAKRDVIMEHNSFYGDRVVGYRADKYRNINIDTAADLAEAEKRIQSMNG